MYIDNLTQADIVVRLVDAHVGKSLFHDAILPLAREGRTVILVTHAQHFISHCDYIYSLRQGNIAEEGTYDALISLNGDFARLDREFGSHKQEENPGEEDKTQGEGENGKKDGAGTGKLQGKLIRREARTTGSVSWSSNVLCL
jgi:ATP-binding cassette, subfamily C (CFTR/MRP), member 1